MRCPWLPSAPSAKPPVLFLHGALSGAWVWAEHVLDFVADRGHAAYQPVDEIGLA